MILESIAKAGKSFLENVENKDISPNGSKGFNDISFKMNKLFSDDDLTYQKSDKKDSQPVKINDIQNKSEVSESKACKGVEKNAYFFSKIMDNLFSSDKLNIVEQLGNKQPDTSRESNFERKKLDLKKIETPISTIEGIQTLIEKNVDKAELWAKQIESIKAINDPNATPIEIRSAQAKLSILKGQMLEESTKDFLKESGLDVETKQRVLSGETGNTRPDVIAKNNTDSNIRVFETEIEPGKTISIECKCGGAEYLNSQLLAHIPNQLSGQEGTKVLLTTADIKNTSSGLAESVCEKYDAKLVSLNVSVKEIDNVIKEVASK